MGENNGPGLLRRILAALGRGGDEIAAGHGSLPEADPRPSTRARRRSREQQRERGREPDSDRAAEAISEAVTDLDEQIRRSVDEQETPETSEEMVERARKRWGRD